MKKCSRCQQYKELGDFSSNKCKIDGLNQECKECNRKSQRKQRDKGNSRWWDLKKNFGITKDQYCAMLDKQECKCAICGTKHIDEHKKRLHVDHCHTTGKIRGLLCNHCNLGIGHLKDDINILKNAIAYLEYDKEVL